MPVIASLEELERLYGSANDASTVKVTRTIVDTYRILIAASPFAVLATCGPEGLDASPRGDMPGFVRVVDERTLQMPDRAGNNRVDSLRNIVRDPRVALLFLIPGSGTTLRANGRAVLQTDRTLRESFTIEGRAPRSVIEIAVDEVYFQCARAVVRAGLWDPARFVDSATLPTPGSILADLSAGSVGGEGYDRAWPERARKTLW